MQSQKNGRYALVLCLFSGWVGSALAETTNLLPVADTALRDTSPDANYGAATALPVGVSNLGSPRNRGLFRFSFAGVPPNAVITAATLRLIVVQAGLSSPTVDFNLHRLLRDWGEGIKAGLPASADEATWNARFHPSTFWASGGGQAGDDYAATPSATASLASTGSTNEFSSAAMISAVQMWLASPGTNFGWMLIATGEPAGTGKLVGSRENPGNEPVLTIVYALPAPPTPPTIFGLALVGNEIRFSFDTESNQTYAVEFQDSLAATNWSILTNIPAQPANTTLDITNTISSTERYFRIRTP